MVAADQDAGDPVEVGVGRPEHRAQRSAARDLEHARVRQGRGLGAAEGGQEGARVDGVPRAAEPVRRRMRASSASWARVSALSTRRRSAVDASAEDGHQRVGGYAGSPVELVDQRRLLPGDEAAWQHPHLDPGPAGSVVHRFGGDLAARAASTIRRAARAVPSRESPSTTRPGERESRTASLPLSGSPSIALPTTTGRCPATEASLRAVGKPPPPRPVSPASSTSRIRPGASRWGSGYVRSRAEEPVGAVVLHRSGHRATTLAVRARPRSAYDGSRRHVTAAVTAPRTRLRPRPSTGTRRRSRCRDRAAARPARARR